MYIFVDISFTSKIKDMRKHLSLLLIALVLPLFTWAQEKLSVSDFYCNEKGMEAMLAETQKLDPNGQKCAIIKVVSTPPLKGLAFDTGQLQVMGVVEKTAETWVYVQKGIKKIQIQHPQLGSTEYQIPMSIKAGRTYTMKLTGDMVQTLTFNDSKSQELVLNVSPSDAEVIINGTVETAQFGVVRRRLSFGTHRYIVRAKDYYEQQGTITINDPKMPQELSINLKPKFGWLRFDNYYAMTDAKLYIDFKYYSGITDEAIRIGSGRHAIRIVKPLYETYEEEVDITDNDTTAVSPELVGNYGTASLTASSPETEIWIDNELRGKGKVDVNLGVGKHEVMCRRKSHRCTTQEITISKDNVLIANLLAPEPIYGSIDIKSSEQARFTIDDGDRSDPTSEYRSDKVLIGAHKVEVKKKGFKTETLYIDVEEGKTVEKSVNMLAIATVTFDSNPQGADFYINGERMSATPYTTDLKSGESYRIGFLEPGYYPWNGTRSFNKDEVFNKNLAKRFYQKNRYYFDLGYQMGTFNAPCAAMGFYASGFNCEFGVKYGLKKSDVMYFTPTDNPGADYEEKRVQPLCFEGKIGYGIVLGHEKFVNRLLLTPQVGVSYTSVLNDKKDASSDSKSVTYAVSGVAALRLQFAICRGVAISVMPSYSFPIKKGILYEQMEKLSDDIKGWSTGMNFSASMNFYF